MEEIEKKDGAQSAEPPLPPPPTPLCLMVEEKVSETSSAATGKRHRQLFVLPPCTFKTHRARLCAPLIETGIEESLDLT